MSKQLHQVRFWFLLICLLRFFLFIAEFSEKSETIEIYFLRPIAFQI